MVDDRDTATKEDSGSVEASRARDLCRALVKSVVESQERQQAAIEAAIRRFRDVLKET